MDAIRARRQPQPRAFDGVRRASTSTAPRRAPSSSPNSNSTTSASTSPRTTPTKVATRLPRDVSSASPRSSSRGWTRAPPSPTSPPPSSRWTNSDKTPSRRNGGGVRKHTRRRRAHVNHETHHRGMVHARADESGRARPDPGGPRGVVVAVFLFFSDPRGSSLDPFASFRAFVPAALMSQVDRAVSPEVIALANASRAVMETAAPAAAAQLAAVSPTAARRTARAGEPGR